MGFENDKLNREKYADFLTEIISNPEKYRRISDSKSLSLAIDSGWGTGKTTFIDMWKEKLENLKDETGKDKFIVISYNAWKNDFSENPFESLVYTIVNHKAFNIESEIAGAENAGKNVLKTGIKLGKTLVKMKVSKEFGSEAGEAIEELLDCDINAAKDAMDFLNNKTSKIDNFFKEYNEYLKSIEELKRELESISTKKKIVMIIDELDRCKPLFAIKLLESVKHIFDVPNISFIFALDMEQLSHSIKCIYGQEMNASGYLCRFFDYISKMPKADTSNYIKSLIENKPLIRKSISNYDISKHKEEMVEFWSIFEDFSKNLNLSLRDINTIYANFVLLENQTLKNINCMQAYSLYLMLLILKYKYIDVFNKIFITNDCDIDNQYIFKNFRSSNNKYFNRDTLEFIMSRENMENILYTIQNKEEYIGTNKLYVKNGRIQNRDGIGIIEIVKISETLNVSNCLFFDDINKWEKIKDKSLVKYIQEQLEFFDFEWEN